MSTGFLRKSLKSPHFSENFTFPHEGILRQRANSKAKNTMVCDNMPALVSCLPARCVGHQLTPRPMHPPIPPMATCCQTSLLGTDTRTPRHCLDSASAVFASSSTWYVLSTCSRLSCARTRSMSHYQPSCTAVSSLTKCGTL